MMAYLAYACARNNREAEAERLYDALSESAKQSYIPSDYMSIVCLGFGHVDDAFAWLQKAREERALHLVFLGVDPLFDGLRSDPRFGELLRTIGLEKN